MAPVVTAYLPVHIKSEMNLREHGIVRNRRFAEQKKAVYYSLASRKKGLREIAAAGNVIVSFIRYGARRLDDDNLASGFKACRDQIADMLGINDGSTRIKWVYDQEQRREYSAYVRIESATINNPQQGVS